MSVFEFNDYKRFLNAWIAALPKKGRGQARKLAEHLGVHPVVVSQVLSGTRDFSHEQALDVATYLGLDERAGEYFVTLVLKARAGTKRLEEHLQKKLHSLHKEARDLENRMVRHQKLDDKATGIFYSNWFYSGARLLTSVPEYDNVDAIARKLGLSRAKVTAIMTFLLEHGLCVADKRGRFTMGPTSTLADRTSPFVNAHHRNWRVKAMERMTETKESDFFYTNPCSLSEGDKEKFREELKKLIVSFTQLVRDSPAEQVSCLNIDWFDL